MRPQENERLRPGPRIPTTDHGHIRPDGSSAQQPRPQISDHGAAVDREIAAQQAANQSERGKIYQAQHRARCLVEFVAECRKLYRNPNFSDLPEAQQVRLSISRTLGKMKEPLQ